MRIPLSWLAEFVTWSGPAAALAERLTMAGLKIEAIEEVGQLDRRIVAGRLAAVEPHPEADRVLVCRVQVGRPAALVAVSGAPGLAAGQLVPVALPGAITRKGGFVERMTRICTGEVCVRRRASSPAATKSVSCVSRAGWSGSKLSAPKLW